MSASSESGGGSRLVALCFDADDPHRLARFWAAALRWEVDERSGGEVALLPTDGTRFHILFLPVSTPKGAKNRIHFDLTTASLEDQQNTVEQLIEMGARHIDVGQGPDDEHVVLADPEGNEFCVIEPTNNFLADCGRLGSITCDGSPENGRFWSEALGWPLVWDQDDETAIRAPDRAGPFITWGPPVIAKPARNRLHLDIAPLDGVDPAAEVDRLLARGATRLDANRSSGHAGGIDLADPDDNEFCVVSDR